MQSNKSSKNLISFIILMLLVVLQNPSFAQISQTINHQGYITDSGSFPVNGTVQMIFSIYNVESGGTALWNETHSSVQVNQGMYNVVLGEGTPSVPINLLFDTQYYLGITVETDGEMIPRQKFTRVPYAFSSMNAHMVDGMHASEFITTETDPVFLAWDRSTGVSIVESQITDLNHFSSANEIDPTVNASVKDGVDWTELTGMPAGFSDGIDDTGSGSIWTNNGSDIYYNAGNVGIGTTEPEAKLDVIGDMVISENLAIGVPSDPLRSLKVVGNSIRRAIKIETFEVGAPADINYRIAPEGKEWFVGLDGNANFYFFDYQGNNHPLFITQGSGNVGIGTTSPGAKLDVNGSAIVNGSFTMGSGVSSGGFTSTSTSVAMWAQGIQAGVIAIGGNPSSSSHATGAGVSGAGTNYDFYAGGPGTNYGSSSSIRWKDNIKSIDNALDIILNIRGVYFDWDREHGGQHDIGFIAEEVGKYIPEIVSYEKDGVYATGMDYGAITPVLLQAIKEQQIQIEQLKAEVEGLKKRM